MLQCFRRILSRTRSGRRLFDESVVPGVFVGDRRFPEVGYVMFPVVTKRHTSLFVKLTVNTPSMGLLLLVGPLGKSEAAR